jgi:hypothetical protein
MTAQTKSAGAKVAASADEGQARIRGLVSDLGMASGEALSHVRDTAADLTGTIADRAPGAFAVSQDTLDEILSQLKASSSETLVLGTVYSAGLWSGLALARAPRLLMLMALLPLLLLGGTLLSRRMPGNARTRA